MQVTVTPHAWTPNQLQHLREHAESPLSVLIASFRRRFNHHVASVSDNAIKNRRYHLVGNGGRKQRQRYREQRAFLSKAQSIGIIA